MRYISTRCKSEPLNSAQAIVKGLADDGGLYIPEGIPKPTFSLTELAAMDYQRLAFEILRLYLTDYTANDLQNCINQAYSYGPFALNSNALPCNDLSKHNFDLENIAPLVKKGGIWFLELFHGRTLAFKDMALSLMPYLMTSAVKMTSDNPGSKVAILVATSGDTGKAALEGFRDVDGVKIIVFYPENGVSALQKRQMTTQEGNNTYVTGVRGNFDDTQTGVKAIFANNELASELRTKGYTLSSANSINIGRLLPQIVYYYYAYAQLLNSGLTQGQEVDFVVPTGNFGNILAGYYAKRMGLPIGTLICASNDNKVLYDFFKTGIYDINRAFYKTVSPSMDILISSNFERLVYYGLEQRRQTERLEQLFERLSAPGCGKYELDIKFEDFAGYYANHNETISAIKTVYEKHGYVIDPHTAVAYAALEKHGLRRETVIVSTASPYKFTKTVLSAIAPEHADADDINLVEKLARYKNDHIPTQIAELRRMPIRHNNIIDKDQMLRTVRSYLNIPL